MGKDRLAAFSDGVIAIIITIMVLELKLPHGADWATLAGVAPHFLSYVLSFIYLAIYWNNHHHLLHTVTRVDGLILWANSHLLFWLSLIPAATAWLGDNYPAPVPTAVYGVTLLDAGDRLCAVAERDRAQAGQAFRAGRGAGQGSQGQDLAAALHCRHRARLREPAGSRSRSMFWLPRSGSCPTAASRR